MKNLTFVPIACIIMIQTLIAHPDFPICSNDLFAFDTGKYFFISEIKPFGSDRFVELYNCRDSDYTAGMMYVLGMYSGTNDSIVNVTVPAHGWQIIPAPVGLFASDALRILCRTDTNYKIMDAVMYTISDSSQSIGLCDWYHTMMPSPNAANFCNATDVQNLPPDSEIISAHYYNLLGQEISNEPYRLSITVTKYKSGQLVVRKIIRAYDD